MTALCLGARVSSWNLQHFCCRWLMPLLRICEEMSAGFAWQYNSATCVDGRNWFTYSIIFIGRNYTKLNNTMYIYAEKYNVFFLFIETVRQINTAQAGANVVEHVEGSFTLTWRVNLALQYTSENTEGCDVALLNGWSETLCCSIDTQTYHGS